MNNERLMVFSAHALDFLWRCSGTIARYRKIGADVQIVSLTCGERGESNAVWNRQPGITAESVREIRKQEAARVATILDAEIKFLDWDDHPIDIPTARILELGDMIKSFRPNIVLTHFTADFHNPDHAVASDAVIKAVRCASVVGTSPSLSPCDRIDLYMFEPGFSDQIGFVPNVYIDITDVMDKKIEAMESTHTQKYLVETYKECASRRGYAAGRFSHSSACKFAEAFVSINPYVGMEFWKD